MLDHYTEIHGQMDDYDFDNLMVIGPSYADEDI